MPEVKIIADVKEHEQARVAIIENGKLVELFIEYDNEFTGAGSIREGDIFKARVENIIPGINAAFVTLKTKKIPAIILREMRFYI